VRKFLDLLAPPGAYPLEKKHGAVCRAFLPLIVKIFRVPAPAHTMPRTHTDTRLCGAIGPVVPHTLSFTHHTTPAHPRVTAIMLGARDHLSMSISDPREPLYEYESEQIPRSLLRRPWPSASHNQHTSWPRSPSPLLASTLARPPLPPAQEFTEDRDTVHICGAPCPPRASRPPRGVTLPPQPPCWDPARPPFGDAVAQSTPL
jgi:hypothetical protein